jgi:glycosyltransferase involved in cell wall biosynthesis
MRPFGRRGGPDIAFFHEFKRPPYGGSNQFLLALRGELERRGIRVGANRIGRATRGAILNAFAVDVERLRGSKREGCVILHRVDGPVALYRGFDDGADALVQSVNAEFADHTVLQSRYSLAAHARLGVDLRNPVVVPNAVDAAIFHPPAAPRVPGRPLRLIATSWSDNPNKGAETLAWLDENLDPARYVITFVGRTQARFRRIRHLPPVDSRRLASVLREHDVFVAPSRHDPASNALLEALACGLPALYLRSGGHPEIVGEAGLGFEDDEEIPALLERLEREHAAFAGAIRVPTIAAVADRYLETLGWDEARDA